MNYKELKQQLYNTCKEYVIRRIDNAKTAMQAAQRSANEETKSSAGDKYETGRAMAQLERDKHALQLVEAEKLRKALDVINPEVNHDIIAPGALVFTSNGIFYFSISAGKLTIGGIEIFAIAPSAPVGQLLLGKKTGESVDFNGRKFVVEKIV